MENEEGLWKKYSSDIYVELGRAKRTDATEDIVGVLKKAGVGAYEKNCRCTSLPL